jgi:hypothetical protein
VRLCPETLRSARSTDPSRGASSLVVLPYDVRHLAEAAGVAGTRVLPQAFRFSLAAELIIEGWPLSFIQAQLGIKTLYAMDRFLKNLDIGPPQPEDVVRVIHTRAWDIAGT